MEILEEISVYYRALKATIERHQNTQNTTATYGNQQSKAVDPASHPASNSTDANPIKHTLDGVFI